ARQSTQRYAAICGPVAIEAPYEHHQQSSPDRPIPAVSHGARFSRTKQQGVEPLTRILAFVLTLAVAAGAGLAQAQTPDPENTLILELETGRVTIALRPDLAPNHVERVKQLAREGFYDGLAFHRVIDGFMAQTGD